MTRVIIFMMGLLFVGRGFAGDLTLVGGEPHSFGDVVVGSTKSDVLTLQNTGENTLEIYEVLVGFAGGQINFLGKNYPGDGGTCDVFLISGETCSLVFAYSPKTATAASSAVKLKYYNNGVSEKLDFNLEGVGLATAPTPNLAILSVSDGPVYDFGSHPLGSLRSHLFTVVNSGTGAATNIFTDSLLPPFSFQSGAFPGAAGTCTATLMAGASCTVAISFEPLSSGLFSEQLEFHYFNGAVDQSTTRNIMATGVSPAILVVSDGPKYSFGSIAINKSTQHSFTVKNVGGVIATQIIEVGLKNGASPFSFLGGVYPGTSGTCSASLAPGSNCTLVVVFAPKSKGIFNETLELFYNTGSAIVNSERDLTGVGK
jgi:hypothetical protein